MVWLKKKFEKKLPENSFYYNLVNFLIKIVTQFIFLKNMFLKKKDINLNNARHIIICVFTQYS